MHKKNQKNFWFCSENHQNSSFIVEINLKVSEKSKKLLNTEKMLQFAVPYASKIVTSLQCKPEQNKIGEKKCFSIKDTSKISNYHIFESKAQPMSKIEFIRDKLLLAEG